MWTCRDPQARTMGQSHAAEHRRALPWPLPRAALPRVGTGGQPRFTAGLQRILSNARLRRKAVRESQARCGAQG